MRDKEAKAKVLGETDHCRTCRNTGLMTCPSHMIEKDQDGWCTTCDSPDVAETIKCECQDD